MEFGSIQSVVCNNNNDQKRCLRAHEIIVIYEEILYASELYSLKIIEMIRNKSVTNSFFSIGLRSITCIYFIWTYILLLLLDSVLRKYLETHETDMEFFTAHITSFELTVILEINATTWDLYSCFHLFSILEVVDTVARSEFIHLIIHPLWDLETEFTIETTVKRNRQESKYLEDFP